MTDRDIFYMSPGRFWAKPGRMMAGGATADETASAICRALAASLRHGGGLMSLTRLADDGGGFDGGQSDLRSVTSSLTELAGHKLYPFRAMITQVEHISRIVKGSEPWTDLSRSYPQVVEIAGSLAGAEGASLEIVQNRIIELYRRYCGDWAKSPARHPRWG